MRESDQRLSEHILGRENHNYLARSSFFHDYEDVELKSDEPEDKMDGTKEREK